MRKIVPAPLPPPSSKDENGAYVKVGAVQSGGNGDEGDLSIDKLLQQGLLGIHRTMKAILYDITASSPTPPPRETVMSLKDVMVMLHELKKKEDDLLKDLPDEELEKLAKK